LSERDLSKRIKQLEKEMLEAAKALEFEKAARLRDQLSILKEQAFGAVVHDQVIPIQAGRRAP
jgi:excinuclease ABC subunit B